ncbi:MAG: hypothetical protein ACE5EZ_04060 [Thermodesulfobacteriota bacterium]
MSNLENFASAIALRISDEWDGKVEFPEDAILLQEVLEKVLICSPEECKKLIGTGIIEEDYFEEL